MVKPDHEMPRDKYGNIFDLVMDPMSLTKRMNNGRVIEPRINSTSMMATMNLRKDYGLANDYYPREVARQLVEEVDLKVVHKQFLHLLGYYNIVNPLFYQAIKECLKQDAFDIKEHIVSVLAEGVQLWVPSNVPVETLEVVQALDRLGYDPIKSKMTFIGPDGTEFTTINEMMTGSIYKVLLEKIARDWSAVANAKLQINGVPSKVSHSDRNTSAGKKSPTRFGETEFRLFMMSIGARATAELADLTNNPQVRREVVENIVLAKHPTRIEEVCDRSKSPLGDHRIRQQIDHLHLCGGIRMVRRDE